MLKVSAIGNIGADPEMQYAATGTARLRFNVACNFKAKNADNEWEDRTEWLRITVFGKRAESLSPLLKKGMRIYVSGRLEARPWTGKDGAIHAGLEVIADDVEFVSSRQDDGYQAQRPVAAGARAQQGADDDLEGLPF